MRINKEKMKSQFVTRVFVISMNFIYECLFVSFNLPNFYVLLFIKFFGYQPTIIQLKTQSTPQN